MFNFSQKIGIDLGTANVLVYQKGKGIVLQEPSVVAVDKNTNKPLAVGKEARRMLGRTPGNIVAIRPLKDGVIADFEVTEMMLKHFISKVVSTRPLFKPEVMVCIPVGITEVERRAVEEACNQVGARKTYLIEEALASAIGAGMPVAEPTGSMIIDIGGGTSEIAVISLGGIVVSESLRLGGDQLDSDICRYVREKYNMVVGEKTAEEIKFEIGSALVTEEKTIEVRGRDLMTGLPRTLELKASEINEALAESIGAIVEAVRSVLEQTPPELASDIMDTGVIMTGGGSLLNNFDKLISEETEIPVFLAEDPLTCVVRGTGQAIEEIDELKGMLFSKKRRAYK
ncbi:MAG: rod shape-determining protein [Bacillota bacterium]